MEYTFKVNVIELTEYPCPLISATVLKDDAVITQKAWLNKPFKPDLLGNIIHEVVGEMFPKKPAEEEVTKPSSPIKTTRGKTK